MTVWNQEIVGYTVDHFTASTLNYQRALRLALGNGHTVSIRFPAVPAADFVTLGSSFHQVEFAASLFEGMHHLLQTEKPVYFTAYDLGVQFAGFSTAQESVGEGLADADA